jgi:hypothetical protein
MLGATVHTIIIHWFKSKHGRRLRTKEITEFNSPFFPLANISSANLDQYENYNKDN